MLAPASGGKTCGHPGAVVEAATSIRKMKTITNQPDWKRWLIVFIFAVAMAWVESAVVFYLRTMIDRLNPYQTLPLPIIGGLGRAELVREAATLVMLLTVGALAGKNFRARFGYTAFAFGVWDIFYYVFLKVMTGWPNSIFDWDILFLLPLPWWGPVLAPVLISLLMIFWGTAASQFERAPAPRLSNVRVWILNLIGVALALYVFMADALRVVSGGGTALRHLLPEYFNWPLFLVALALMAAPVVQEIRLTGRLRRKAGGKTNPAENTLCAPTPQN